MIPPCSGRAHALCVEEVGTGPRDRADNRMPYVSFVESAGADLRSRPTTAAAARSTPPLRRERPVLLRAHRALQDEDPDGLRGLRLLDGGRGLPAGPVDYNIVVKGSRRSFSPGHPGQDGDGGGVRRRVARRCGAPRRGLRPRRLFRRGRDGRAAHLPGGGLAPQLAQGRARGAAPAEEPAYDAEELLGLVSRDLRQPVDVRDVIARVADGSRFEEFKARYGPPSCAAGPVSTATRSACSATTGDLPRRRREGRPLHPAVQPDRRAAALPPEHHRLHRRARVRSGGIIKKGSRCSTR